MPLPLFAELGLDTLPALAAAFGADPGARMRREINNLMSPAMLARLVSQNYRLTTGSPGYTLARNYAIAGSNASTNAMARNFGRLGMSDTGIGALASAVGPSALGLNLGKIDTDAYNSAMTMSQDQLRERLQGLLGSPFGASRLQTGLAESFKNLIPFIRSRFATPGLGGGVSQLGMPNLGIAGDPRFPMPGPINPALSFTAQQPFRATNSGRF